MGGETLANDIFCLLSPKIEALKTIKSQNLTMREGDGGGGGEAAAASVTRNRGGVPKNNGGILIALDERRIEIFSGRNQRDFPARDVVVTRAKASNEKHCEGTKHAGGVTRSRCHTGDSLAVSMETVNDCFAGGQSMSRGCHDVPGAASAEGLPEG